MAIERGVVFEVKQMDGICWTWVKFENRKWEGACGCEKWKIEFSDEPELFERRERGGWMSRKYNGS